MEPSEIAIWVGIVAGSSLVASVIVLLFLRESKRIVWSDLSMIALAIVLILGSQYSKIKVLKIIELEKEVTSLRGEVQSSLSEVTTLTAKIEDIGLSKIEDEVYAVMRSAESSLSEARELSARAKHFRDDFVSSIATVRDSMEKISTLSDRLDGLKEMIKGNEVRLTDLGGKLKSEITILSKQLNSLQKEIEKNEMSFAGFVDTSKKETTRLLDELERLKAEIEQNKSKLDSIEEVMTKEVQDFEGAIEPKKQIQPAPRQPAKVIPKQAPVETLRPGGEKRETDTPTIPQIAPKPRPEPVPRPEAFPSEE